MLCQFVDGLPEPTRSQVRALKSGSDWKLVAALECAKSMLRQHETSADIGGGFLGQAAGMASGTAEVRLSERSSASDRRDGPKCSGCHRRGHMQKDCRVRCFACNGVGHMKRDCVVYEQGNGHRGAV